MITRGKLITSRSCATAFVAGAMVLVSSSAFADAIPALPKQISVTAGATQLLEEGAGAAVFGITVKNVSAQAIGITGAGFMITKLGGPDPSDHVMGIMQTATTCPKNNLAANAVCTFTFDVTPVAGASEPDLDFGITSTIFTVTPNRGPTVSVTPSFIVRDDHASITPEPATLTLLASGAIGIAALKRLLGGIPNTR